MAVLSNKNWIPCSIANEPGDRPGDDECVVELTEPDPPLAAMQATEFPLAQAMINCSASVNHEPDNVVVAALAAPALPASTNAISRVAGEGSVCVS